MKWPCRGWASRGLDADAMRLAMRFAAVLLALDPLGLAGGILLAYAASTGECSTASQP